MEEKEVIDKYPSLCYTCEHARKPAAESNRDIGWVGCAEYARKEHCNFVGDAKEIGEGWVDLRASIFGKKKWNNYKFSIINFRSKNLFGLSKNGKNNITS